MTRSGEVSCLDSGRGRVALFIHGVGTNALLWRNVIAQLEGERRCIAIDLPLHGQTRARPEDLSLPALATVIEDFCDALGLEKIDLVANDSGGAISQVFAVRRPSRLASLTLTNCETHDNLPPPAFALAVRLARLGLVPILTRPIAGRPDRGRKYVFASGYEHPERLDDEVIRAFLDPVLRTYAAARDFGRLLASLRAEDLLAIEPQLRRFTVPTLVVWGTGDVFFHRRWAHWLKDTIPGVTEVVELEGARLFFPDERADELVTHLRRHWSARAGAHDAIVA